MFYNVLFTFLRPTKNRKHQKKLKECKVQSDVKTPFFTISDSLSTFEMFSKQWYLGSSKLVWKAYTSGQTGVMPARDFSTSRDLISPHLECFAFSEYLSFMCQTSELIMVKNATTSWICFPYQLRSIWFTSEN